MQKIKLSIPGPCRENWDNMAPGHQGRFCSSCAKTVIDFSQMSDPEVLNYFSRAKNEKVCGRLYPDQLDRTIQALPTKTFLWRWNYIIAFFLFFTKAGAAKAQGGIVKQTVSHPYPTHDSVQVFADCPSPNEILVGDVDYVRTKKKQPVLKQASTTYKIRVKGRVTGENGEAIPGASISILPGATGLLADEEGNFTVKLDPRKDSLRISAIGYEVKMISASGKKEQKIILKSVSLQLDEVMLSAGGTVKGRMVMMGGMIATRSYTITDTIKNFLLPAQRSINIYPNPVQKGSVANITLKLKKGMYNLQLLDARGNLLLQKQLNSTAGGITEPLEINPTWPAGNYFIRVFDARNKKTVGGNFIIL